MLFMVSEHYTNGPGPVYQRAAEHGRMLPDGLHYVDSWVVDSHDMSRCFQIMETDDAVLFDTWMESWQDLVTIEVFPLLTSSEAAERVGVQWSGKQPDSPPPSGTR